jgi:cytosine deaminase
MELVVRNARLLDKKDTVDISVEGGFIRAVGSKLRDRGEIEIDAHGSMVLPTFVEPHVHLDKVFLAERIEEADSMVEARRLVKEAKSQFTEQDVTERAEKCIHEALLHGVTAIRTHVDVDPVAGLKSFKALSKLKEKYSPLVTLQLVAFPQEGLVRDEKTTMELLERAAEMGADAIGGLPEAERDVQDGITHLKLIMNLAVKYNLPLDVHCDVLPYTNYIEHLLELIDKNRFKGSATADHLIALAYYDDSISNTLISRIKDAGLNVVTNPCTAMVSGSEDPPPKGRGITRVKELLRAGVNIAYGLDNVVDPYNPFGEFDPVKNGWLLAYEAQLNREADFTQILKMSTYNAASILCLQRYGIRAGCIASFNIMSESTPREILRKNDRATKVVVRGRTEVEYGTVIRETSQKYRPEAGVN